MKRLLALLFVLGIPLALLVRSAVFVDETEYVLITEFGRPTALYGDAPGEAGAHWRKPWQEAIRIDRRLRVFDTPTREVITGDKRNFEVSAYAAWRVADPTRFLQAAGTAESAEARVGERISAALSDTIGRLPASALASVDTKTWAVDRITSEVASLIRPSAMQELGVEIVDVRLTRFVPPVEVRPAVFELIRSERKQVAAKLRAEGETAYSRVLAAADRERDLILARADADAERIRGQGEAEVTRILNEAHLRDPSFYEFLRTLETYRALLDDKATVVLSSASPLLRLLSQGPASELTKGQPKPTPGPNP